MLSQIISGAMKITPRFGCTIKQPFVQYGEIIELGDFSSSPGIFSLSLARVKEIIERPTPTETPRIIRSGSDNRQVKIWLYRQNRKVCHRTSI